MTSPYLRDNPYALRDSLHEHQLQDEEARALLIDNRQHEILMNSVEFERLVEFISEYPKHYQSFVYAVRLSALGDNARLVALIEALSYVKATADVDKQRQEGV